MQLGLQLEYNVNFGTTSAIGRPEHGQLCDFPAATAQPAVPPIVTSQFGAPVRSFAQASGRKGPSDPEPSDTCFGSFLLRLCRQITYRQRQWD